jgi:spore coat protein A
VRLSRRQLLQAGAASAAALLLPTGIARAVVPAGVSPFTEQLPTLTELGVIDATLGRATVHMVTTAHSFHAGLHPTPTFAYRSEGGSQSYLGPVIVARRGVPFTLTAVNELGRHPLDFAVDTGLPGVLESDRTAPCAALHLHGGNVAPQYDGGPLDTFTPGSTFDYEYPNTQEAAGLWFHDHALGITRLNVYAGLAGGYLIRDDDDPGTGGKFPTPPHEVPLIIQDRMFNADGSFAYPAGPTRTWAPEFFGDVATVNGKAWPNLTVDRGKYRFRVYNGSNARFYNLRLIGGAPWWQIGTDGGLLDAPVRLSRLLLGPGERADVIVDFGGLDPGATVRLANDARTPFPTGPRPAHRGGAPLPQIMQFMVGSNSGFTGPVPASLRQTPITRLAGRPVARTRTMSLVEITDEDDMPVTALLNNRHFESTAYESAPVAVDTLEEWELVNLTGDAHPIHLHYTQFQLLDRQAIDAAGYLAAYVSDDPEADEGPYPPIPVAPYLRSQPRPPAANERGWKDTVVTMPGEVTRIRVPFGPAAADGASLAIGSAFTGTYVWHCHILEHEDNDMMQRYLVQ